MGSDGAHELKLILNATDQVQGRGALFGGVTEALREYDEDRRPRGHALQKARHFPRSTDRSDRFGAYEVLELCSDAHARMRTRATFNMYNPRTWIFRFIHELATSG